MYAFLLMYDLMPVFYSCFFFRYSLYPRIGVLESYSQGRFKSFQTKCTI